MLARRTELNHPLAGNAELPLLIPAFSSKGFQFKITGKGRSAREYSEVAYELQDFGKQPRNTVLISAYDLYFKHFEAPERPRQKPEAHLRQAHLVFLDSGGYELLSDFDTAEVNTFMYSPKEGYGQPEYELVLERLTKLNQPLPLVISNFDYGTHGKPLSFQIQKARALFGKFPDCMSDVVLKPWTKGSKTFDPKNLSAKDLADLRGFDIIGVTEKDLGKNLFDRIKRVAKLRKGLDDVGVMAPIHIWGGLDPLMTPLFFFAGAEIFDGISWLRYAYQNGVTMNRESYLIVSDIGVTATKQLNHLYASLDNLTALSNLTIALQQWVDFDGKRFDMFHPHVRDHLEAAYKTMTSKIDVLKGGE